MLDGSHGTFLGSQMPQQAQQPVIGGSNAASDDYNVNPPQPDWTSGLGNRFDDEFAKLLDEIPRATSAPPHLHANKQDEQSSQQSIMAEALGDIRLDEDYEQFYQNYSGQRKLPPPVQGRTLYQELPGLMRPRMQSMGMHPGLGVIDEQGLNAVSGITLEMLQAFQQISAVRGVSPALNMAAAAASVARAFSPAPGGPHHFASTGISPVGSRAGTPAPYDIAANQALNPLSPLGLDGGMAQLNSFAAQAAPNPMDHMAHMTHMANFGSSLNYQVAYQAAYQAALLQTQQQLFLSQQAPPLMPPGGLGPMGLNGMPPGGLGPMGLNGMDQFTAAQLSAIYPGVNLAAITAAAAGGAGHSGSFGAGPALGRGGEREERWAGARGGGRGGGRDNHRVGAGRGAGGGGAHHQGHPESHEADSPPCKFTELSEVEGQLMTVAKDQNGCRFLQRKFDEGGATAIAVVFPEILDNIVLLMSDPFGNYLVQKLLDRCSEQQRLEVLQRVSEKGELVSVALNTHGTRAVQKLIETLSSREQREIVIEAFRNGVVSLIKDLNGNHVVQRCLKLLGPQDSQFIYDAAAANCVEIASHRHGCCVLQRCIDFALPVQKTAMVDCIASHALILSQDSFGNYVVQYVLELGHAEASSKIINALKGKFPELAMQKFSSNVVEKCLKLSGVDAEREEMITELMSSPMLLRLLQDAYGNYVIQGVLAVTTGAIHEMAVDAIRPFIPSLRGTPHGKRILQKMGAAASTNGAKN